MIYYIVMKGINEMINISDKEFRKLNKNDIIKEIY